MGVSKNSSFPRMRESSLFNLLGSRFSESDDCELLEVP